MGMLEDLRGVRKASAQRAHHMALMHWCRHERCRDRRSGSLAGRHPLVSPSNSLERWQRFEQRQRFTPNDVGGDVILVTPGVVRVDEECRRRSGGQPFVQCRRRRHGAKPDHQVRPVLQRPTGSQQRLIGLDRRSGLGAPQLRSRLGQDRKTKAVERRRQPVALAHLPCHDQRALRSLQG
jgi:hypothetical protein